MPKRQTPKKQQTQAADLAQFAERSQRGKPRSDRVPMNSYLPADMARRLRVLAWTMSAREGRRVAIADLLRQAVHDYLEANGG